MTIDEMISALQKIKDIVGGDAIVPVMRFGIGENDYVIPEYLVKADLEDQDGTEFKCALIGSEGGEELTEKGIPHWEWTPLNNKV